jgi:hypothetical protein
MGMINYSRWRRLCIENNSPTYLRWESVFNLCFYGTTKKFCLATKFVGKNKHSPKTELYESTVVNKLVVRLIMTTVLS